MIAPVKTLLLLCTALAPAIGFASDLDFTLVNKTNRTFEGLYISAAGDRDWDGNLLSEGQTLASGQSLVVKFETREKSANWDLNIVDADGTAMIFKGIRLPGADTVTLSAVNGKVTAEVE